MFMGEGASWLQREQWGSMSSFASKSAWVSSLDVLLLQIMWVQDQLLVFLGAILIQSLRKAHLKCNTRESRLKHHGSSHVETGDHLGLWCNTSVLVESRSRHEALLWRTAFKFIQYMSFPWSQMLSLSDSLLPRASLSLPIFWLMSSYVGNSLGSSVRLRWMSPQSLPSNITVILGEHQALLIPRAALWMCHFMMVSVIFCSDSCWWLSTSHCL